jgi:hypothetical protein
VTFRGLGDNSVGASFRDSDRVSSSCDDEKPLDGGIAFGPDPGGGGGSDLSSICELDDVGGRDELVDCGVLPPPAAAAAAAAFAFFRRLAMSDS